MRYVRKSFTLIFWSLYYHMWAWVSALIFSFGRSLIVSPRLETFQPLAMIGYGVLMMSVVYLGMALILPHFKAQRGMPWVWLMMQVLVYVGWVYAKNQALNLDWAWLSLNYPFTLWLQTYTGSLNAELQSAILLGLLGSSLSFMFIQWAILAWSSAKKSRKLSASTKNQAPNAK